MSFRLSDKQACRDSGERRRKQEEEVGRGGCMETLWPREAKSSLTANPRDFISFNFVSNFVAKQSLL